MKTAMARFLGLPLRGRRGARRLALGILGFMALLYLGGLLIGLRVDSEPLNPATPADGMVCQVCQPPGEPVHARCAIVLSHPLDEVWAALTDYENYGDICSSMHAAQVSHDPSGPTRLEAEGDTFLGGRVPFAVRIDHERQLDRYTVTWTDTGGDVRNRGQWTLTPRSAEETLVELKQEVEVSRAPTFMVRAFLLPRLRRTVAALEQRLANGPSGKPW